MTDFTPKKCRQILRDSRFAARRQFPAGIGPLFPGALVLGLLLFFFLPARAGSVSSGETELGLLVKNVRSGQGFRSDFVQKLGAPGTSPTLSEGSLIYKSPGLMILRYTTPSGQWLKLDGNKMALYVPQNRQVLLKTIHKHRIPETPAILLASIPEISRWFLVRPVESGPVEDGQKLSVVLVPRHPDPHLAEARLTLIKGKGILTDLLFMEQNGTTLSISLHHFRILSAIGQKDLAVGVPGGTTVVPVQGAF